MTPLAHEALDIMIPTPRFTKWIADTLKAQEERTKQKAPLSFHDKLYIWEQIRQGRPPTRIETMNAEDWESIVELIFNGIAEGG